jgi:hypothetical protein
MSETENFHNLYHIEKYRLCPISASSRHATAKISDDSFRGIACQTMNIDHEYRHGHPRVLDLYVVNDLSDDGLLEYKCWRYSS